LFGANQSKLRLSPQFAFFYLRYQLYVKKYPQ
jgi:hypothetical protein